MMISNNLTPNFVPREVQIQTFLGLIKGFTRDRFLFVEGPSGSGKKTLLNNFEGVAAQSGSLPLFIDCGTVINHNPIYLLHRIRHQWGLQLPPAYFADLDDAMQKYLKSAYTEVPIKDNGELRIVRVSLMLVRANLMMLDAAQFDHFIELVEFDPKHVVGKSHADRVNLFLQLVSRRNAFSRFIEVGRQLLPASEWWQSRVESENGHWETEWEVNLSDLRGQRLANTNLNEAFQRALVKIQDLKKGIIFLSGADRMTRPVEKWVWDNLVEPINKGRFEQIYVVFAGRDLNHLSRKIGQGNILRLGGLSRVEAAYYLFEKRKVDQMLCDFDLLYQRTQGDPAALATWADAYFSILR